MIHSVDALLLYKFVINWKNEIEPENEFQYSIFTIHDCINIPLNKVDSFYNIINRTIYELFFENDTGLLFVVLKNWIDLITKKDLKKGNALLLELIDVMDFKKINKELVLFFRIFDF